MPYNGKCFDLLMEGELPMLDVRNISKSFGTKVVLEDVSLEVKKGDVFGLLGPKGAGKTTMLKIIMDLYKAEEGTVLYLGDKLKNLRNKGELGVCFREEGLDLDLTVYENMEFYDRLYSSRKNRDSRIELLLDTFKLSEFRNKLVGALDSSMQRRLNIARVLLPRPNLLLLDEPTDDLPPDGQLLIQDILANISTEVTMLISSCSLGPIQKLCNKVAVLKKNILYNGFLRQEDSSSLIEFVVGLHNSDVDREALFELVRVPIAWCKITTKQFVFAVEKEFKERVLRSLLNNHLSMVEVKNHAFDIVDLYRTVVMGEE